MIGRMPIAIGTPTMANTTNPAITNPAILSVRRIDLLHCNQRYRAKLAVECGFRSSPGSQATGARPASCRTSGPLRASVAAEDRSHDHDDRQDDGLHPAGRKEHRLGPAMAPGKVRQVKQRRPVRRPAVEHFEGGGK
jgi:hypothetical protein